MKQINYEFKDSSLMDLALTQSGADRLKNNERLEFLGDRVVGLGVAELLYKKFPDEKEGELARRHAKLVSTQTLARVAISLGLDKKLRCGHLTAGRSNHVFANAMEAVLGAIFLDSDFNTAKVIVADLWESFIKADIIAPKDSKTKLQEYVQKATGGELPVYEFLNTTGAPHMPVFNVRVTAMGRSAEASGPSKKFAAIAAAAELLKILAI